MKIDILLPHKEIFSKNRASAVSLTVRNSAEFSKFKKNIHVFGQFIDDSFENLKFTGIKPNKYIHFGNNRSILLNYIKLSKECVNQKKIIEIHNRPYLFNTAIKKNIKAPITLHFHNDPREMKGSKTIQERKFIADNSAAVYFVSKYIKNCFLEDINKKYTNLYILPNGIERRLTSKPDKKKEVVFIGRLVSEKGAHIFVESIKEIVRQYKNWNFKIIGTSKAGQNSLITKYEKKVIQEFEQLGENTTYLGFLENNQVQNILKTSSILVVPSLWDDPFPLTALEGLSNGVAIIASNRGGLTEMLDGRGLLIKNIDNKKLETAIMEFLNNKSFLEEYKNKSWNNYIYNQSDISQIQDSIRDEVFNKYYK